MNRNILNVHRYGRIGWAGGVGLGLNIVQDIIHSHGGQISLGDAPGGGLRINITLPR